MNQKEELKKDVKKSGDQSKKKKKLIAGIAVGVAVIGLSCAGYYYVKANENKLKLKEDVFSVEYGEKISLEAKDYVTADESVLKETKVKINYDVEKEKDYTAIGTYDGSVTYKKENHEFKVEVKDTTAPVFKDLKKEIKVEQNAEDVDFTKYFKAEDISKVKITVNDKKIDLSKTGEYELEVTATDAYDNKATKKIKVIDVEADKADEVTETTDGEKPLSSETKQKKEEQAKVEQEQANTGGNSNTSGGSSGGSTNGGSSGNNGGGNSGGGSTPAPAPAQPSYRTDISNSYAARINAYRQQNGLPALPVTAAAQAEANQRAMALVSNYGHNESSGFTENIGHGSAGVDFVSGWQGSPAHNTTMLRGDRGDGNQTFTAFAVAVVEYNGRWYAVTSFQLTPW